MPKRFSLFFLPIVFASFPSPAHAYLDPGTGSMILQILLGGVAGVLVVGRLYWHRIKEFFGIKTAPDDAESQEKSEGDQR